MSRRAQMILRNAAFLGPAGSNGLQGVQGIQGIQGNTGPAGMVASGTNAADSATLTNTTVATAFAASVQKSYGANTLAVGNIIRSRWSGIITTGAAQAVSLQGFLGAGVGAPNYTVPTAAATYHFHVELETIIRTIGAGGTCSQTLRVAFNQDSSSNAQSYVVTQNAAIDTTAANAAILKLAATVANNTGIVRSFHSDLYSTT